MRQTTTQVIEIKKPRYLSKTTGRQQTDLSCHLTGLSHIVATRF